MQSCKVCFIGFIVQGSLFCEACRSFYRRNLRKGLASMKCASGTFNCRLTSHSVNKGSKRITPYRIICRACRLKRCIELVTELEGNSPEREISMKDNREVENSLTLIVTAKHILMGNMRVSQLRRDDRSLGAVEAWLNFMGDFPKLIVNLKTYGSIFPAFVQLPLKDRISFFMKTRLRILAGEGLLHADDYYLAGINHENFKKFRQEALNNAIIGPILEQIVQQAEKSWTQIQNLKLTTSEQAFFLAFLFFDGNLFIFFLSSTLNVFFLIF